MKKILIIEDQEDSYRMFVEFLREELPVAEYEIVDVGATFSVGEAEKKIATHKPDLILLDMNLGERVCDTDEVMECDGVAVLKRTGFDQSRTICTSSSSDKYRPVLRRAGVKIHHPKKWWMDLDALPRCILGDCDCQE